MLIRKEWDQDYIAAKHAFNTLRAESDLVGLASKEKKNTEDGKNVRNTLNDYELIAVGIRHGILDEEIYKSWFKSSLIKDYISADSYISEVRRQESNPDIFCEFEALALRWGAKDGYKVRRRRYWPF
jgi:hypothetical protein